MDRQEFKIYCSQISKTLDTEKARKKGKNQPLILEGVASTSDIDLEGDFITPECIENFKLQATQCNIHNNHNVGLDDVIGTVLEVLDTDSQTLKIKFSILPLFREHIEQCIDNGVKLGLSIGGTIVDYTTDETGLKIKSMMLHEISLTPLPANWNTMGTVVREGESNVIEAKCLNGVCKQLENILTTKNVETVNEVKVMETEKRYYTKDEEAQFLSEDRVVELINEALNNFATNGITEERVGEIIDAKLKEFVEQAKALEKAEIEKAKKEAEAKAKKEKAEKDEEEEEEENPEEVEEPDKEKKGKKAVKEDEETEEEEEEEEVEEEEEEKSKKGKKTLGDLTPQEFGEVIATAINSTNKSQEPSVDILGEIETLKKELHSEITKAISTTKEDIEKSLFDDLMKNNKPRARGDDEKIRKFLKTKSEEKAKDSSTLNVKDIAKTLARD